VAVNNDYDILVALMETRFTVRPEKGIDMIIKHIPDSDADGVLDQRVLKTLLDFKVPDLGDVPGGFDVEVLRRLAGFPNKDMTCSEIKTEYRDIETRNGVIPIRVYSPLKEDIMPAVVFFHGGGFFGGSVDTVENCCKALAEKAGAVVVSVAYSLAPERKFPVGLEDCFDAVKWVWTNVLELKVDRRKIAVAGDSAGGNLAAVCAMMDRDLGTGMINFQALIYPVVILDFSAVTEDYKWDIKEYVIKADHEVIKGALAALRDSSPLMNGFYVGEKADLIKPYASPLLAEDAGNLPETLIITAEYDYLRLQGEAYARKLTKAGVKTKVIRYSGVDHAFIDKIGVYPQAEDCMNEIAKALQQVFKA